MKNKKKGSGAPPIPGWMASYADMVTVLMAFFILLFAMSKIDADLFDRFITSFNPARVVDIDFVPLPGGGGELTHLGDALFDHPEFDDETGAPGGEDTFPASIGGREPIGDTVGDIMNTFATYLADNPPLEGEIGGHQLDITSGEGFVRINIGDHDGVFFNSGQAVLTPAARNTLDYLGPLLSTFAQNGNGIIIEGHTDDQPITGGAFPSNWTLSGARASSVVEYLVNNFDIDVHMIAGLGRGEYFPVADNRTAAGRAQNRRVEIKIFDLETTGGGAIGGWFTIPGT